MNTLQLFLSIFFGITIILVFATIFCVRIKNQDKAVIFLFSSFVTGAITSVLLIILITKWIRI